jgi:hypothetical protein
MNLTPRSPLFLWIVHVSRDCSSPAEPLNDASHRRSKVVRCKRRDFLAGARAVGKFRLPYVSCRPSRLTLHQRIFDEGNLLACVQHGLVAERSCVGTGILRFSLDLGVCRPHDSSKMDFFLCFVPDPLSSKRARGGHNCWLRAALTDARK